MKPIYVILVLSIYLSSTASAFNFKSILFGDDVKDEHTVSFGTPITDSMTTSRADIPCKHFICEETNVCVTDPKECPCKRVTDKKCLLGDWYICIRGDQSCDQL